MSNPRRSSRALASFTVMAMGAACTTQADDSIVTTDALSTIGEDPGSSSTTSPGATTIVDPSTSTSPETTETPAETTSVDPAPSTTGDESTGTTAPTEPEVGCGNEIVEDGEECDEGDANNEHGTCIPDVCTLAFCGDGHVFMDSENPENSEECDLGDDNGPDATCDEECNLQALAVFVTSLEFNGNLKDHDPLKLSGVGGADEVCQALADEVGLPQASTFKAWLSDGVTSPAERFTTMAGGRSYALLDGTPVANDWDDLVDGTIANPINLTELWATYDGMGNESQLFAMDAFVWTNTRPDANSIGGGQSCANWSDASSEKFGWFGWTGTAGEGWTKTSSDLCSGVARLYCFEQPEPGDG